MAHFAELDLNNKVLRVIVLNNEVINNASGVTGENDGVAFLQAHEGENTIWKQTSYNSSFRGKFAGIGFTYDSVNDVFVPPQPYPSWVLQNNVNWVAPVDRPTDGKIYDWNENTKSWVSN